MDLDTMGGVMRLGWHFKTTALGTSEGTVKNHASSILSQLGVRDRTRAVLNGVELGYL